MALLGRQIRALIWKDILVLFNIKRRFSTIIRAFVIPIVFTIYISVLLQVYWPKENYGVGSPTQGLSLAQGLAASTRSRDTLVLVNSIAHGGDIDRVIQIISDSVTTSGKIVKVFSSENDLIKTCESTLQGTTNCYGAVVFNSSPKEGPYGKWNYTLRGDGAFGSNIDVDKSTNDVEVYQLPLQRAVDNAIAAVNTTGTAVSLPRTQHYPFTSMSNKEWKKNIIVQLQNGNIHYLSIVWYIGFIGVMYQLVGLVARERETGMADLIESMMPNVRRWEPQMARIIAHHLAFTATWGPSWIIMGIIAKVGLYPNTSGAVIILYFILSGLALTSCSIFAAAFFRKAQLSGISTVVLALCLGIVAQVTSQRMNSATVIILGLLFSPMTFVFGMIFNSRWEHNKEPANLLRSAPGCKWGLSGIVLWILLCIQIFAYPLLAMYVERWLYGTAAERTRRQVSWDDGEKDVPVKLSGFTKIYHKNLFLRSVALLFRHKTKSVVAVDNVSLASLKGQIMVLVGANGCGKTTILNAIAGLSNFEQGSISVDGSGGIGLCPQQNVLWNGLTVEQHAEIFHRLKCATGSEASNLTADVNGLIQLCGLEDKRKSTARVLSGGQKRKLQLIMMLIGGSRVCCVDEVSGGLDPLSRRRIWDILLAERGRRTFILTTHFLDEAEYLADHITIISKGRLQAQGSTSELKAKLGNGYRFTVPAGIEAVRDGALVGLSSKLHAEHTFATTDPAIASDKIRAFKAEGVQHYQIAGPTIEEVFMKLATDESEHVDFGDRHNDESNGNSGNVHEKHAILDDSTLLTGHRIGTVHQTYILFKKRFTVLRWNWVGYFATIAIPIVAAALVCILLNHFRNPGCDFLDQISIAKLEVLSSKVQAQLVVGPPDALTPQMLALYTQSVPDLTDSLSATSLLDSVHLVNSTNEFLAFTQSNYSTIIPGGLYLGSNGSVPMFNYRSNIGVEGIYSAIFMQNAMDVLLSNQTIIANYAVFDYPWPPNTEKSLQFVFYFGLAMAAYPAFFALYPTMERLRGVRALQYSNGVRSLPLWLAYTIFDGLVVLFISVFAAVIFVAMAPNAWYNLGYLFICIFLYGLASVHLSYLLSLFAKSQLGAFAMSAGGQAFMLLMYMSAYMSITSRSRADEVAHNIILVHFTLGLITPIGQLIRALLIAVNLFSILCVGAPPVKATNPNGMLFYGGPIVYLIGQSLFCFAIFIWYDHGFVIPGLYRGRRLDPEESTAHEPEVSAEISRATTADDGLRVLHVSKTFSPILQGHVRAVEDLSFGVKRGEVFAVVGPNGAGKSTTISMLRGELKPDRGNGEIYIGDLSVLREREGARSHLGVCPQHDALDQMTVLEHLRFYAGIRGLNDIEPNVQALVAAVGLAPFAGRMANKLSGGNKRKLSLAIALIGNPEVLLLDEPSSGMDPLAKRSMWKTLSRFVPHRSILLTTHSMEEADALADRVGVLANHMLDIGTTQHLRGKYGHGFHIHLVLKSAPNSSMEDMDRVREWVETQFPGAEIERAAYHGQLRFNIPSALMHTEPVAATTEIVESTSNAQEIIAEETTVGTIFLTLETQKAVLGLEYYSVSPSTFDEVFLKVVGKHGIEEEDNSRTGWQSWIKEHKLAAVVVSLLFPWVFLFY